MWTIITQVEPGEPGPATLISPKGTITEITPTYTWNPVATSSYYFFEVREGADNFIFDWFTADEANCGDGTSECSVTPETELADGSYNWRILSLNDFGFGPWSDPLSFNVNTAGPNVIVDDLGNVTRIENLPVVDETTGATTIYNVRFVAASQASGCAEP